MAPAMVGDDEILMSSLPARPNAPELSTFKDEDCNPEFNAFGEPQEVNFVKAARAIIERQVFFKN
jgi:hypothetical protein